MKIKITDRTELMFSQAVTLAQNGMMKSTIHASGRDLYILNMDDTILIHFRAEQELGSFSFFANDYESNEMEVTGDQVVFVTNTGGYSRRKTCSHPKIGYSNVKHIWEKFEFKKDIQISFNKDLLSLLDDELSHVEFHNQDGLRILQKNIYSGARIEIQNVREQTGLLGELSDDFEPIGFRTADFKALFSFCEDLTFYVQKGHNWLCFADSYNIFEGILGTCLYDELPYTAGVK
jgi:hypothetical protein